MTKSRKTHQSSGLRSIGILCCVVAILYFARELLIPLAFAITVSMILNPVVAALRRLGVGRGPSALLVITVFMAVIGGISLVIFKQLVAVAIELPQYRENISRKIDAIHSNGKGTLGRAADSVKDLERQIAVLPSPAGAPAGNPAPAVDRRGLPESKTASRPISVRMLAAPTNELQYLGEIIHPFLRPLAVFGMVLIFSLFLLIEHDDLRNRLFRLGGLQQLNVMTEALDDATQRVSRYLLLQFLVNVCFGVLCGLGLFWIGVPYAPLWGAVAAILRIVPYVGSIVAAAMPFVLSLAVFDGWRNPVLVLLLFGSLELVTGNLVEPWLYGIHTGISALALLLTTVFWAALWGPSGLILSTPLTVCVAVLGRHVPQFSFLHILLGDDATLAIEAQIYQRLLAMDEQEARAVVDLYLKDHTLTQLYDLVLIPMLSMAERDRHKGALHPAREEFLFLSLKEMLDDLPDFSLKPDSTDLESKPKPASASGRVICIPANDEADEISAAMLSQLLEMGGAITVSFPVGTSLPQLVRALNLSDEDTIFVSAVPPFAFSPAKTLSRQVRMHFPRAKIVVGVWGFAGDAQLALEHFRAPRPDLLVTSLEQAVSVLVKTPDPQCSDCPAGCLPINGLVTPDLPAETVS